MTGERIPYTDIVLIHWISDGKINTTVSEVIAKFHALYGQQTHFTVEAVNENDPRICWESLPERTPPTTGEPHDRNALSEVPAT